MPSPRPGARGAQPGFERPLVTVDVVIFTVMDERLKVLLVRRPEGEAEPFAGRAALPGGFIDVALDSSLQACALRKLREKTGFAAPYLEQLGSWGSATRDPRGWCATHVYFALVPTAPGTRPGGTAASEWVDVDGALRKRLAFDHGEILAAAVERLRGKVEYTSLPAFLLPEPFTLPQLHRGRRGPPGHGLPHRRPRARGGVPAHLPRDRGAGRAGLRRGPAPGVAQPGSRSTATRITTTPMARLAPTQRRSASSWAAPRGQSAAATAAHSRL